MTLKTRLFGKKIQEEALEKLVEAIGKDKSILSTSLERWFTGELNGKCTLIPVNDGIAVDLYIFRTDIHYVDGTISADYDRVERLISQKEIRNVKKIHLRGKIPYELGDK